MLNGYYQFKKADKLKTSQDTTTIINEISIVETNIKELELKYNE